jgi:regulator of nucleoside diphosphate kinase
MKNQIHITKADQIKLVGIMEGMKAADERRQRWLVLLEHELDRANIVESHEIPRGTVTLHSRVRLLDLDSRESVVYTLVLPREANSADGSLSILAPIGIAMLGYGEGDRFECETPGGIRRFLVESVLFQPEADALRRRLLVGPRHSTEKAVGDRTRTEVAPQLL